jgi:hypothetical protein
MDGATKEASKIAKPGDDAFEQATTPDVGEASDQIPAADAQALAMEKLVEENAALSAASKVNAELWQPHKGMLQMLKWRQTCYWASAKRDLCFVRNRQHLFEPPDGAKRVLRLCS